MSVRYLIYQARGTNQASPNPHTSRRKALNEWLNQGQYPQLQQQLVYGNTYTNAGFDLAPQHDASRNQHIPLVLDQYQTSYPPSTAYPSVSAQEPKPFDVGSMGPRPRLLGAVFLQSSLKRWTTPLLQQLRPTLPLSSTVRLAVIHWYRLCPRIHRLSSYSGVHSQYLRLLLVHAGLFAHLLIGFAVSTGANSMPMLLVGHGVSEVGAAGLISIVRIILSDSASIDNNNTQGAAMVAMYAVGYAVGPILGGILLKASWRWVFGINLPIGAASMVIMWILIRNHTKGPQPPAHLKRLRSDVAEDLQNQVGTGFWSNVARIDFVGAILFIVFGILILLGLNWGSTGAWDDLNVIVCLVNGGASLLIFVVWEYLADHSTDHLAQASYPFTDIESPSNGNSAHQTVGRRARVAHLTPSFTRITDDIIPMTMFRSYDIVATNFATMASGMIMLGIFYFRMLGGLYPPIPPISPTCLQTCRYTLRVWYIVVVIPAFYDAFLDTRSGFALVTRAMVEVCPCLLVQRRLSGQSALSDSGNFRLTLPAVWFQVDSASGNTEVPFPRKHGYESDSDAKPYSPSNPGPVGTFYPASVLSEWKAGIFQSDNMVTIQALVFDETENPIHPALSKSFSPSESSSRLRSSSISLSMTRTLFGTTHVTELHVLTYAEDAPPPEDGEEDNDDDNGDDNASPRDPTPDLEYQKTPDTEDEGGNVDGAETRPAAGVFGSTAANPLAEAQDDSVPDFFHAVSGGLDDDVTMADTQGATGVPKGHSTDHRVENLWCRRRCILEYVHK